MLFNERYGVFGKELADLAKPVRNRELSRIETAASSRLILGITYAAAPVFTRIKKVQSVFDPLLFKTQAHIDLVPRILAEYQTPPRKCCGVSVIHGLRLPSNVRVRRLQAFSERAQ